MRRQRLGILGGGQLGRMLAMAARPLGVITIVVDPDAACPAAATADEVVVARFTDAAAIAAVAARVDVLTVEIEHVNAEALAALPSTVAVRPAAAAIALLQDKLTQKQAMADAGVPVGRFRAVSTPEDVAAAAGEWGYPLMLKSRRLAYDGRGNAAVRGAEQIAAAWASLAPKGDLFVEAWVPFVKELAVIAVVGADGGRAAFPAVEALQRDSICHVVRAPAPVSGELLRRAQDVALKVVATAAAAGGVGVFGVELFLCDDGQVLLNEVAPRVHNTGHFTIEAAECDQFSQHVRAVLGLPLGSARLRVPAAAMVNILGFSDEPSEGAGAGATWRFAQRALSVPGASLHWYDKAAVKRGRKMGHITITGDSAIEVERRLAQLWGGDGEGGSAGDPTGGHFEPAPLVGVIMGSDSDLPTMAAAVGVLRDFGVPHEVTIVSAHRTPARLHDYAATARSRGLKVIIAGAGGAAHLPGMVASVTPLPVIGVPIPLKYLDGMDSLLSIVQMPKGIPVATVGVGNAANAGLLAVRILGCGARHWADACEAYQAKLEAEVLEKAHRLEAVGVDAYLGGAHGGAGAGAPRPAAGEAGGGTAATSALGGGR